MKEKKIHWVYQHNNKSACYLVIACIKDFTFNTTGFAISSKKTKVTCKRCKALHKFRRLKK